MKLFTIIFTVRHGRLDRVERASAFTIAEALTQVLQTHAGRGYGISVHHSDNFPAMIATLEKTGVAQWGWGDYKLEQQETALRPNSPVTLIGDYGSRGMALRDFFIANPGEPMREVINDLDRSGVYCGGGGAMPSYTLRVGAAFSRVGVRFHHDSSERDCNGNLPKSEPSDSGIAWWMFYGITEDAARDELSKFLEMDGHHCSCGHDCCNCGFAYGVNLRTVGKRVLATQIFGRNI